MSESLAGASSNTVNNCVLRKQVFRKLVPHEKHHHHLPVFLLLMGLLVGSFRYYNRNFSRGRCPKNVTEFLVISVGGNGVPEEQLADKLRASSLPPPPLSPTPGPWGPWA